MLVISVQSVYDAGRLYDIITAAKSARCRQRFVIPVILYEGKVSLHSPTTRLSCIAGCRVVRIDPLRDGPL